MKHLLPHVVLIPVCLAGCCVGPCYCKPDRSLPSAWTQPHDTLDSIEDLATWWDQFHDPLLSELINALHQESLDIQIALARIYQAQQVYAETCRNGRPDGHFEAAEKLSVPGGFSSQSSGLGGAGAQNPFDVQQTRRSGLFYASWEIDLFGYLARQRDAAYAGQEIACYEAYDGLTSLIAEFATSYFLAQGLRTQMRYVDEQVQALENKRNLIELRLQHGIEDATAVDEITVAIAGLTQVQESLRADFLAHCYHIAILLAREPGDLLERLESAPAIATRPEAIPLGLPADLLQRRPDIRLAEWQLTQSIAMEGVAVSAAFPRLSLDGSLGYELLKLGSLSWDGIAWSLGGTVVSSTLDYGRTSARIEQTRWQREQASLHYERTVLAALEEAEKAIIGYHAAEAKERAGADALEAQRHRWELSDQKLKMGIASAPEVIDQLHHLLEQERSYARLRSDACVQLVQVYRSLGGGWKPCAD